MWQIVSWATALALFMVAGPMAMVRAEQEQFSPYVTASGAITLPDPATVRTRWTYLGTWAVQGDAGVDEFHAVYTQPSTIDTYRRTGEFPDGAVLVKEVRTASHASLTTGEVARSDTEVLWFVMIKDRESRFPDHPLWAKGWGWALFLAEDRAANVATDFRADCMACHLPAQRTDWVYTKGYPVLSD